MKKLKKSRRSRIQKVLAPLLAVLLFLAGACVFFYPTVSNYLAEKNQMKVIENYEETLADTSEEDLSAEWAAAEAYNESLAGEPVHDPFVVGSGYALPDNYTDVLNVDGDGVMGYLEIPKIDVMLPIYHGTSEEVLAEGVGHIESTSLPIGGTTRHAVLSAHRGLPSAKLFTRLDELEVGDLFYIYVLDEVLAYEVDQIQTVLPDELDSLQAVEGEDLVTLVTCTPYGINTHRLLVRGTRTEYIPEEEEAQAESAQEVFYVDPKFRIAGTVIGITALFLVIVLLRLRRRNR